ncbi:MAG: glycerol kinase GlpK [Candidatus Omnitrophica bacterium]|nr:glycerol kinase GlpK [Candidatus Omnitrophota bacterium]
MEKYILALDQGTTSSRAILFDHAGGITSCSQKEFSQIFPKPGWVEHDANEIWQSQLTVARQAIKELSICAKQIAAIGITNQRETVVLWDRNTGKPASNAIVWQCRRTADICEGLKTKGVENTIREKTGLLLDPYFSGTKVKWLLDNVDGLRARAEKGEICFGTVDSWLIFNLTGEHVTDPSNASRTLLFNIVKGEWDKELLDIMDVPACILPSVRKSSGLFGITKKEIFGEEIPVSGVAGDQQAALFGQACFTEGDVKNTYGTGCFMLVNTGKKPVFSKHKLLTTVAWDIGDGMEYALEGSIFVGGDVIKWLRDQLKIIETAACSEEMALSEPDSGGVSFVPAFVGLGAPYWDPNARGAILGLTRGTTQAHIIRASLNSIALQSRDLFAALEEDMGKRIELLKVDGGASINSFLMQTQADILNIPVVSSAIAETTALGAAYLAGLHTGYWKNKKEITKNWIEGKRYTPKFDAEKHKRILTTWKKAVEATRMFTQD